MSAYDIFQGIENKLWHPFKYAMRMTDDQAAEHAIIFGIYSGAYKNGMDYLVAMEAFELALIVDDYNQKMAGLDAEEQNTILDVVTRRYLAQLDKAIHDSQMISKRQEITAEDDLWAAKIEALSVDRAALLTLAARLEAKEREIAARIATLRAQIQTEEIELELAELEVARKELEAAQAQTDLAAKEVDAARKDVEIAERNVALTMKDVELARKDVEIAAKVLDVQKVQMAQDEGELKIIEAGLDAARIQMQIVEAGLKLLDAEKEAAAMNIQAAGYDADIAKTGMIEVDLKEAQVETALAEADLKERDVRISGLDIDIRKTELQQREIDLEYAETDKSVAGMYIDETQTQGKIAQTDIIAAEYLSEQSRLAAEIAKLKLYPIREGAITAKQNAVTQAIANVSTRTANENTMHDARVTMMNLENNMKTIALDNEKTRTLSQLDERKRMAQLGHDLAVAADPTEQALAALRVSEVEARKQASFRIFNARVDAAEAIANAEIETTLRHSIG